jgi:hypothetical protein
VQDYLKSAYGASPASHQGQEHEEHGGHEHHHD